MLLCMNVMFNLFDFFIDFLNFMVSHIHFIVQQNLLFFCYYFFKFLLELNYFFNVINQDNFCNFQDIAWNSVVCKQF